MKDIKIDLNASEASREAYWRKRCDVVEAELARLRAELATKEEALKGAEREIGYMKGQRKVLKDKINDIAGDAAKSLVDATAKDEENARLRAANAELKETVRTLQTEYVRQNPCTDPQDEIDELERETCVWTASGGAWFRDCAMAISLWEKLPETCPACGKQIEVAGKAEGSGK